MMTTIAFLALAITITPRLTSHSAGIDRRAQEIPSQEDSWITDTSFGFPVQIGANIVTNAPAWSRRQVYLYIQPEDFTEAEIREAMTGIARKFTSPWELWIY